MNIKAALQPGLLSIDLYVFVLHTLMTAIFVALPFLLKDVIEWPLAEHWKLYLAALTASLVGTVPLILADEQPASFTATAVRYCNVATGGISFHGTGKVLEGTPVFCRGGQTDESPLQLCRCCLRLPRGLFARRGWLWKVPHATPPGFSGGSH